MNKNQDKMEGKMTEPKVPGPEAAPCACVMAKPTYKVYLSGPMTDIVQSSTGDQKAHIKQRAWRAVAVEMFQQHPGVQVLNPYRGRGRDKKIRKVGSYLFSESSNLIKNSVGSMLVSRDHCDVENADIILANLTRTKNLRASIGTISEMAWAYHLHKPVVCVIDDSTDEIYFNHPFLQLFVRQWVKTVEEGVTAIMQYWHPDAETEE